MTSEKYVIATAENSFQILLRNILDPCGYFFMDNCSDSVSLMRLIRQYHPDFILVDTNVNMGHLRVAIDAADDEMLCPFILFGEHRSTEIQGVIERSKITSFCRKPVNPDALVAVVENALGDFAGLKALGRQIREAKGQHESKMALDKAKSILMKNHNISEEEAYRKIRSRSMQLRSPMKEVAESIIVLEKMKNR
ncbi:MAG: ANTAR domain-containing protein [Eubacteriales bacterium]|nr:ANTAR domain-containing protein [Eubacteriales bacterium]